MEEIWESHKLLCVSVGIVLVAITVSCLCRVFKE